MTPNTATINVALDNDFDLNYNDVTPNQDRRSDRNRGTNTLAASGSNRLQTTIHRVSDPVNMSRTELHTTLSAAILEDLDDAYDFAQLDEIAAVNDELDDLDNTWDDTFGDDDRDFFSAEDDAVWAAIADMMATPIRR